MKIPQVSTEVAATPASSNVTGSRCLQKFFNRIGKHEIDRVKYLNNYISMDTIKINELQDYAKPLYLSGQCKQSRLKRIEYRKELIIPACPEERPFGKL